MHRSCRIFEHTHTVSPFWGGLVYQEHLLKKKAPQWQPHNTKSLSISLHFNRNYPIISGYKATFPLGLPLKGRPYHWYRCGAEGGGVEGQYVAFSMASLASPGLGGGQPEGRKGEEGLLSSSWEQWSLCLHTQCISESDSWWTENNLWRLLLNQSCANVCYRGYIKVWFIVAMVMSLSCLLCLINRPINKYIWQFKMNQAREMESSCIKKDREQSTCSNTAKDKSVIKIVSYS